MDETSGTGTAVTIIGQAAASFFGELRFDPESRARLLAWADKQWRKKKRRERMARKKRRGWA